MASASSNPYLVTAALVAAGLDGMRRGLTLPPPRDAAAPDGGGVDATPLPSRLRDSLDALQSDSYMVGRLGPELVAWFVGVKEGEMRAIEARLAGAHPADTRGASGPRARMEAWRHMYFEYL